MQFSEDVTIDTAELALVGSADLPDLPALSSAIFSYSSDTQTATWIFRSVLPLDKYLLDIPSAAVTNGLGAALDGDFTTATSSFPSGDGTAGGDFDFRFNILPGDVNQDGVVTGLDGGIVRQQFLEFPTSPGYNALLDTTGKGAITGLDLLNVQGDLLTQLPTTDPLPPAQGNGNQAAIALAAEPSAAPALEAPLSKRPLSPSRRFPRPRSDPNLSARSPKSMRRWNRRSARRCPPSERRVQRWLRPLRRR